MKWTPQADGASPVIMVRSLPKGTTEQELVRWAEGFVYEPRDMQGRAGLPRKAGVVKALVLHDRMLGFVQFGDIWAARSVMAQFVYDPPSIVLQRHDGFHPLNLVYSDKPEIRAQNKGRATPAPAPVYTNSRLILVVLKELSQAVTIDELFWTFTQVAKVEKISSFTKDNKNQIVVQFETAEGAASALNYFNGKYLPANNGEGSAPPLCFLAIVPSKLSHLTFRNQDGRNRDYSEVNMLISSLLQSAGALSGNKMGAMQHWAQLCAISNISTSRHLYDFIWGQMRWGEGWLVPKQDDEFRGRVQPNDQRSSASYSQGQLGQCMHISGLPSDDSVHASDLFRICGIYGEVRAVKMLYKFRGCAVVQFADSAGCNNAIHYLHGLEYKGRTWDAKVSRQPNAMHWNGASDDLQKRMVSSSDPNVTSAPRCDSSSQYPSRSVLLWDVPMSISTDDISMTFTQLVGCAPPSIERVGLSLSEVRCVFQHLDNSILAAINANGTTVSCPRDSWLIKMRFLEQSAAKPPAAHFFRMGQQVDMPMPLRPPTPDDVTDDDLIQDVSSPKADDTPTDVAPAVSGGKKKFRPPGIPRPAPAAPGSPSARTDGTPGIKDESPGLLAFKGKEPQTAIACGVDGGWNQTTPAGYNSEPGTCF
eukprot:TRINITY_DN9550_c2_g4_i1.p1 TRINITY_DN9550_c2_g4~~TRINITY_DN9550_c2_g4_i1.p1  ORF type:complete len:647 (+),score=262.18 TRINITY_DN9550_c2_g4_i1:157-2097(+)